MISSSSSYQAPEDAATLAGVGKDIDSYLSQEFLALSFQERSLVQEEVHGVTSLAVEETSDLISTSLKELVVEIENIPQKPGWDKAMQVDEGQYVKSQEFQLKFLRADLFDAKKAARRTVIHLDLLSRYYGKAGLQRHLRYDDLTKREQSLIRAGTLQVLPQRDRNGRIVDFHYKALSGDGVTTENRVRVMLYHSSVFSEDVESQKKGIVMIVQMDSVMVAHYLKATPQQRKDVLSCWKHLPVRISAQHYCMPEDSPTMIQMIKGLWGFVNRSKDECVRVQVHSGLDTETKYKLMTFGIPSDLPVTSSGNLKTKNHLKWIKMRRAIDEERAKDPSGASIGIICPANADVLFESGGGKSNHYGNADFASIMEHKIDEYGYDAKYGVKYYDEVIALVRERNGRFLERDPEGRGWWVEITDVTALHKRLYSALYEHKKRMKGRRKNQQFSMSESSSLSAMYQDNKRQKLCQGF